MKRAKKAHGHGNSWGDEKRIETVTTWLALGNCPMTSAVVGVPTETIRQWKLQSWWADIVGQLQSESDQALDAKLSKIVDKSLDVVVDRIDNGDFYFDKESGEVKRRPVGLRDVTKVSEVMLTKRDLIRKNKQVQIEQSAIVDHLKVLHDAFAAFVQDRKEKVVQGDTFDNEAHVQASNEIRGLPATSQEQGSTEQGAG